MINSFGPDFPPTHFAEVAQWYLPAGRQGALPQDRI